MYVSILVYRARAGEEDAVIALHEDWQRTLRARWGGSMSGELLCDPDDPQAFVTIARFADERLARQVSADPEHLVWFRRIASLCAEMPAVHQGAVVWQDNAPTWERCLPHSTS